VMVLHVAWIALVILTAIMLSSDTHPELPGGARGGHPASARIRRPSQVPELPGYPGWALSVPIGKR